MKYLIVKQQSGYGCDYSIGCGISTEFVEAESAEEAFSKMADGTDWMQEKMSWEYDSPGGEHALASIWVIPAPELNEHLWPAMIEKMNKHWSNNDKLEQEAADLAEFERLKAKFGK